MLQGLATALAQVKAGNASENFTKRNQKNHILFVLSNIKKTYNNIINSAKV